MVGGGERGQGTRTECVLISVVGPEDFVLNKTCAFVVCGAEGSKERSPLPPGSVGSVSVLD